jgi:hypothetical protein
MDDLFWTMTDFFALVLFSSELSVAPSLRLPLQ